MLHRKNIWIGLSAIAALLCGCHEKATGVPDDGLVATSGAEKASAELADNSKNAVAGTGNELRLLQYALIFVNARYVEPKRVDWKKMTVYALDAIQKQIPEVVVAFDKRIDDSPTSLTLRVNLAQKQISLKEIRSLADTHNICIEAFNFVFENLNDPQNEAEIEYAMVNGMFSTLDPHTNLLPPYMLEDMMTGNGGFAGCGFVVGVRDNQLTVISPMEGAPAWRAGIKAGDMVVRIDDESTENMPLQDAVDRMRGESGSKVTLYILRRGWTEPKPFVITRENIVVKSVTSKALKKDNIGYLKLKSFDQTTAAEVKNHLKSLHAEMPKMAGLIIDLRNNSGGLLLQSTEIAEQFLQKGDTIVAVEGPGSTADDQISATITGPERGYPIVILTNEGTASASEIVSGALQFHNRAVIMGERTFGKGSVQIMKELPTSSAPKTNSKFARDMQANANEICAIKVTSAQYLTPGDISIQGVGIIPDVRFTPQYVDKETGTNLSYNRHVRREDSLEQSLHSEKTVKRQSFRELSYLYQPAKEEEERAKALGLTTHDLRSTEDYTEDDETRFAISFLKQVKSSDRAAMLESSVAFFDNYLNDYNKIVTKTLAELGVDWTLHVVDKSNFVIAPKANDFSWGFEMDGVPVSVSDAGKLSLDLAKRGQEQVITMWARNDSANTYEGVTALMVTNQPYFDEREFVFGTMAPGETRRWDIKLKVPYSAEAREDVVEIDFTARRMFDAAAKKWVYVKSPCVPAKDATGKDKCEWPRPTFDARIVPVNKPRFAWTAWVDDSRRGNADSALSRGESVDMYVWVKNDSDVDSDKVVVALGNESGSGVLLQNARVQLDPIPAGGARLAHLSFDISTDRPQKPPTKRIKRNKPFEPDSASLILMIDDNTYSVETSESITIPVLSSPATPSHDAKTPAILLEKSQISADLDGKIVIASPAQSQVVLTRSANDQMNIVCWPEDELLPCAFAPKSSVKLDGVPADKAASIMEFAKKAEENSNKPALPKFSDPTDAEKEKSSTPKLPLPPKPESPFAPKFLTYAPTVKFITEPHTEDSSTVTVYAEISDDEMLKSYEAYVWTMNGLQYQIEKIDYALVTTPSKKLAIELPLKKGDNSLVVIARDRKDIEGSAVLHIQRK